MDAVNDKIRIDICACMNVWDFTGILAYDLSLISAGVTKPYLRLIGAPYYAANMGWGNRIQDVAFTFNAYFNNEVWYSNYCPQHQIEDTVRGFFNAAILAYTTGNADVYVQCKTDGKNLAVAVSNCSCDYLYDVKISLSERYGFIEGVGFDCELDGDCVTIGYMPPLSFGIVKIGK